ncbi:hypothetical protein NQ314_015550 [Rhamnusium bicolor]|uniref:DUF243 domain-containing protein n=1 Tax=Rhamnusium bicolor TaxID=1586634 RepID=A0AAV8WYF9_9CUCU|nr:hypothetical protein NQ314_015550 [Rhamnusium bicolor]
MNIDTISAFVVLVHGRPEPPSGYNYQSPPASRYGAPSGAGDFSQNGISSFGNGHGSGGGFGQGGYSSNGYSRSTSQGGFGHESSSDSITVNKHVYVHLAPPEIEERDQPKTKVIVPPPQKHYKIIFIKAPTPPTPTVPDIPPIQQDEEKTLVYVLIKKPEEQPEIVIPTAPPTEPSKPEVYFIKYKPQKEESGEQGGAGNNEIFQDDTVEVGARQGGGQNGSGYQRDVTSFSSSTSTSRSPSNGVSSQYGPPEARGSY